MGEWRDGRMEGWRGWTDGKKRDEIDGRMEE